MKERTSTSTSGATRQVLLGVFVAGALCAVGILHVAGKVSAVESGYQLGKLEETHRSLEREHAALVLQLATLRSAAHIETTARTKLGMVAPSAQRVFKVGAPISTEPRPVAKRAPHKGRVVGPSGVPVAMLSRDE